MERGGVGAEDSYQVRLEIITQVDAKGKKAKPIYKIKEVIRFVPAAPTMRQASLLPPEPEPDKQP